MWIFPPFVMLKKWTHVVSLFQTKETNQKCFLEAGHQKKIVLGSQVTKKDHQSATLQPLRLSMCGFADLTSVLFGQTRRTWQIFRFIRLMDATVDIQITHLKFKIDTFRKRTGQWNIHHLKMYFLLKMVTFNVMLFFQGVPKIATIISTIHSLNFQGESLTPLLEFLEITQWCPLSAIQLMIFLYIRQLPKFFFSSVSHWHSISFHLFSIFHQSVPHQSGELHQATLHWN